MNKVFSAPKAHVVIEGQVAGFVRNLNFTENIQRQDIRGLGNLYSVEVPAVSANNTFSVDQFFISFNTPVMKKLINRHGSTEALKNTLILGEIPISIAVYKKTVKSLDSNSRLVTEIDKTGEEVAVLRDCFIDTQNWTMAEGGIASSNVNGRYLTPVGANE
jgi:hypothetical protein